MSDGRLSLLNDPGHWHRQAAEMRKLAGQSPGDLRDKFLKIASEYEALANKAERRLADVWTAPSP